MAKYLLFSVGSDVAGIEIGKVAHIFELNSLNTNFSEGIVNGIIIEQNKVFGVVDIRNRIDKNFLSDKDNKVIVVDISENNKDKKQGLVQVGFVVDKVIEITSVEKSDSFDESLINRDEVKQMIDIGDKIYPILNMGFFLNQDDLVLINKLIDDYKKQFAREIKSSEDAKKKETEKIFRKKKIEKIWRSRHLRRSAGKA